MRPDLRAPFFWRQSGTVSWIAAELPCAVAAFSTRSGGRSDGPYRSLNLGILTDDDPALVAENRMLLASALGREARNFAMGLQVHGAVVQRHLAPPRRSAFVKRGERLANVDAQATSHAQVTPLVLVADCVPVVLSLPGAVAVVHCGWRGLVAGVLLNALRAVCELGRGRPEAASAALGPGIGACCYEVGPEVIERFRSRGHGRSVVDGSRLDLADAAQRDLIRAGMGLDSITKLSLCTGCHAELFFSHRRDGDVTGRQAGLAWLNA